MQGLQQRAGCNIRSLCNCLRNVELPFSSLSRVHTIRKIHVVANNNNVIGRYILITTMKLLRHDGAAFGRNYPLKSPEHVSKHRAHFNYIEPGK